MCIPVCLCEYTCVGSCIWEGSRLMPGFILDCSITFYAETGFLSQTQMSPIQLVLLASLFWGSHVSTLSGWNYRNPPCPLSILSELQLPKPSSQPCEEFTILNGRTLGLLPSKCPTMEAWVVYYFLTIVLQTHRLNRQPRTICYYIHFNIFHPWSPHSHFWLCGCICLLP